MQNELFLTADGSHSLRSEHFGVPYHSVHGAIQESDHVFIKAGLQPVLEQQPTEISILEMGMGTGLNVLLTLREAAAFTTVRFHYTAFELYPLQMSRIAQLNYPEELPSVGQYLPPVHEGAWNEWLLLRDNFRLKKVQADFARAADHCAPASVDIIYYDAFAPASQPELWVPAAMEVCFNALKPGGVLVTYCAKGQFKRDLRSVGFKVEPLPGPPGKREMTRGRRPNQ